MASLFEPPALLTLAVVLLGGGAVLYLGLRPALRGPLPVVTSEHDEVWGVEDPPPPPKRPYVYLADRKVAAEVPRSEREPEPLAIMPARPTLAPVYVPAPPRLEPLAPPRDAQDSIDEDDEELSLADLFRPKRRSHAAPNDAPTQD